jgi:hypothetical protein
MENSDSLQSLRLLYFRYKDTPWINLSTVVLILLVSMVLIGRLLLPQIQNWFSVQKEVAAANERIKNLRANQLQMSSMSDAVLANQLKTVTTALPIEKDYAGILQVISVASINAGVALNDYSFSVGDLSTQSATLTTDPSISLKLSVEGEISRVIEFLKELNEKVPLAEIITTDISEAGAEVSLLFFFKVIPEKIPVSYTEPFKTVEGTNAQLLLTLEEWRQKSIGNEQLSEGSSSAGMDVF